MTKITANVILLVMAAVWAYLSVMAGELQEVSQNFITLGLILAGGDIGAAAIKKYGGPK